MFCVLPEHKVMSTDAEQHGEQAVLHKTQILLFLFLGVFLGVVVNILELLPVS